MSASKASKKASPEEQANISIEAEFFEIVVAAVGPNVFNMSAYKKMAQFSTTGRTVSSFEHFFRDRKKRAVAMLAADPSNVEAEATPAKTTNKRKADQVDDEESQHVETSPAKRVAKRTPITRKRKTTADDEHDFPAEPVAKKAKEEELGDVA